MITTDTNDLERAITGCLLGAAVGDALGLCCEGLPKQRQARLYPDLETYHLLFKRGMVSDDTEHACMTAQAAIVAAGDADRFARDLGRRLRGWLLGVPAGIGYATLRAILKLWLGSRPDRSGVFSAGNGPAMRSAALGVCYGGDPVLLQRFVRASTRLTHTDPKAEYGALAVAVAAHLASTGKTITPFDYLRALEKTFQTVPDLEAAGRTDATPHSGAQARAELLALMAQCVESVAAGRSTEQFADDLGLPRGVSGYMYHTVPVVAHAWLSHPTDFRAGVQAVIRCGGDTDTTAAILGGIQGAGVGKEGIPALWLAGLLEWPRSVVWMENLGRQLTIAVAEGGLKVAPKLPYLAILPRNLLFLVVVLAHGFRRLLPPY